MKGAPAIPRVFHRVWLGDRPLPAEFERYGQSWLAINPGWVMRTWTTKNLPELRNHREFETSQHFAQQSALLRYEVLEQHGGVYVDTDFECLRPIAPLLVGASFMSSWADAEFVNNALIGAVPGHRILREMIDVIPYRIASWPGMPSDLQSGVRLLTETATSYAASDPTVILHEPHLLHPYHWREPESRHNHFPEAYAIHHWTMSWVAG